MVSVVEVVLLTLLMLVVMEVATHLEILAVEAVEAEAEAELLQWVVVLVAVVAMDLCTSQCFKHNTINITKYFLG